MIVGRRGARLSLRSLRLQQSTFSREGLLSQPVIFSDANEKVKSMKALQMKKKRDAQNVILLDGHRQVIDALSAGFRATNIVLTHRAITSSPLASRLIESLERCDPDETQVTCVEDQVLTRLSDVMQAQGVLAAFTRPNVTALPPSAMAAPAPLLLLLDRPADPGNVGTIIRAGYGLGVDALLLAEGCDVYSPKVTRAAMGMNLQLPCIELGWPEVSSCVGALRQSPTGRQGANLQVQILVAVPLDGPGVVAYENVDFTGPTLLVIGSEADGVGKEAMGLAKELAIGVAGGDTQTPLETQTTQTMQFKLQLVRIPCAPGRTLESFNAAMAATVLLAEAAKQRRAAAAAGAAADSSSPPASPASPPASPASPPASPASPTAAVTRKRKGV